MFKEIIKNNNQKPLWYIGFIVFGVMLIFVIISSISIFNREQEYLKNFSIDGLSDEEILSTNIFSARLASGDYMERGIKTLSQKVESYTCRYKCKEITGIKNISTIRVSHCTLTLDISSSISAGKAKIAVICNDKIVEYMDFGENKTLTYEVDDEHVYFVKLLGESAELEIKVIQKIQ